MSYALFTKKKLLSILSIGGLIALTISLMREEGEIEANAPIVFISSIATVTEEDYKSKFVVFDVGTSLYCQTGTGRGTHLDESSLKPGQKFWLANLMINQKFCIQTEAPKGGKNYYYGPYVATTACKLWFTADDKTKDNPVIIASSACIADESFNGNKYANNKVNINSNFSSEFSAKLTDGTFLVISRLPNENYNNADDPLQHLFFSAPVGKEYYVFIDELKSGPFISSPSCVLTINNDKTVTAEGCQYPERAIPFTTYDNEDNWVMWIFELGTSTTCEKGSGRGDEITHFTLPRGNGNTIDTKQIPVDSSFCVVQDYETDNGKTYRFGPYINNDNVDKLGNIGCSINVNDTNDVTANNCEKID